MAEKKEIVIGVKLDIEVLQKNAAELSREIMRVADIEKVLKKDTQDLVKAQKELADTGQQNSKQYKDNADALKVLSEKYQKNATDLRDLKSTLKSTQRDIDNVTKASRAETGSVEELRAKLSLLTGQYDAMSQASGKASADAQHFAKEINKTTEGLKKKEAAIGNNTRNVGNYRDSLKGGIGTLSQFGAAVGAAFSVGAILSFGKSSVEAFEKQEVASRKLLFALDNNKSAFTRLEHEAGKLQKTTIYSNEDIMAVQAFYAAQGLNEAQIKKTTKATLDYSTVTGKDLQAAQREIAGTFEGSIGRMGKLDKRFKDLTKEQLANGGAVDIIIEKYGGFSEEVGKTATGTMKQLSNAWVDIKERIGGVVVKGILPFVQGLKEIITPAIDSTKAIREEQLEVNILTTKLMNNKLPLEERNKAYEKLKLIAPDVVKNISVENINMSNLTKNLIGYNKQAIIRLMLAEKQDDIDNKKHKASVALSNAEQLRQDVIGIGLKQEEIILKRNIDFNESLTIQRLRMEQGKITIRDWLNYLHGLAFQLGETVNSSKQQADNIERMEKSYGKYNKKTEEAVKLQTDLEVMAKRYGVDLSEINTMMLEDIGLTKSQTEAEEKAAKAADKSKKDEIKNQYELQKAIIDNMQEGRIKQVALENLTYEEKKKKYETEVKDLEIQKGFIEQLEINHLENLKGINEKYTTTIKVEEEENVPDILTDPKYIQAQLNAEYERKIYETTEKFKRDELKKSLDKQLITEEIYRKEIAKLDKQESERKQQYRAANLQGAADVFGAIGGLAKENSIASKAVATAQALINTYLGVTAALTSIPFTPANFLQALAVGITGAANVAKINSVKAARGAIVRGSGTGISDSVPAMLSTGESVINARSTAMYKPLLSKINTAGGGVSFMAGGGIASREISEPIIARNSMTNQFLAALKTMPNPVVGVKEFTRVSDNMVSVKQMATI